MGRCWPANTAIIIRNCSTDQCTGFSPVELEICFLYRWFRTAVDYFSNPDVNQRDRFSIRIASIKFRSFNPVLLSFFVEIRKFFFLSFFLFFLTTRYFKFDVNFSLLFIDVSLYRFDDGSLFWRRMFNPPSVERMRLVKN